jgi:hypothetical protein
MRTLRGPVVVACTLLGLTLAGGVARGAGAAETPLLLEDGVARMLELPDHGTWNGRVHVPDDATALSVAVCSRRDVDLYLRRGQPLPRVPGTHADVASRGAPPLETVRLDASSPVPLKPGVWWLSVAPAAAGDRSARFELVAFVDRGRGTPTFLPGDDRQRDLAVHRDRPELRTFLPTLARRLTLSLAGADRPGVRFRIDGPGDYRREGTAPRTIVLDRDEAPAGAYVLDLSAPRGVPLPDRVRVRITWTSDVAPTPSSEPQPIVQPGHEISVTLGGSGPTARTVRVPVEPRTGGVAIEATNPSGADVDLYVRRGGPLTTGDQDADYFALSSAPSERILLGGMAGLPPGTYYCEAVLVEGQGPVPVTLHVTRLEASATRGTWGEQAPEPLQPGVWARGRVQAQVSGLRWYAITVPRGARSFHAQILGATAPLDLVIARRTDGSIMRRALTARVDERIDHVFDEPVDGPRLFVLGVMNRNATEKSVRFRVAWQVDRQPDLPPDVVWPPIISWQGRSPTVRAAAATVELTVRDNAGGSGTCLTPKGRILTCRHVLEIETGKRGGGIQREGILVAFPAALDRPPVQSFLARVTDDDPRRDLALLEITSDVFGRPVPPDLHLPWIPLGDSSTLELGDPVMVFGYPTEGSERSRTPVILTRGTISGLESADGAPRWIKTDAWIGLGHSGGCLVDAGMRLVGVPAATLGRGEVLGLAVPVSLVPAAWKLRILKDQPR